MAAKCYTYRRTSADLLDFECGATPSGIAEIVKGSRAHQFYK